MDGVSEADVNTEEEDLAMLENETSYNSVGSSNTSPKPSKGTKPTTAKPIKDGIGEVLYKFPDTMEVFTDYKITVRISKEIGTAEIAENLSGKITRSNIRISSKMEVMIVDPSPDSAFVIKKINMSTQIIDSIGYTEWVFGVRPIKSGERSLDLVISIIVDGNQKQKVYSDQIHVRSHLGKEVKTFWNKYWQWMFTTLLIPIFVYFRKNFKKDKQD